MSNNENHRLSHDPRHPEFTRRVSVGFTPWRSDYPTAYVVTYLPLTEDDNNEENFYDLDYIPEKCVYPKPAPNTLSDYSSWIVPVCNSAHLIIYDTEDKKYHLLRCTYSNDADIYDKYRGNYRWRVFSRLIDLENYMLRRRDNLCPGYTAIGSLCFNCGYRMYFNVAKPIPPQYGYYYFRESPIKDNVRERNEWRFTRPYNPTIEKNCPLCGAPNPLHDMYPRLYAKFGDNYGNVRMVGRLQESEFLYGPNGKMF